MTTSAIDENVFPYTENDSLDPINFVVPEALLDDVERVELHIKYKPFPLVLEADWVDQSAGTAEIVLKSRFEMALAADAAVDDLSVTVANDATYAALPDSGEFLIAKSDTRADEHVRYSAKAGAGVLTLEDALTYAHTAGDTVERLPDLRAGRYEASVVVFDADEKPATFSNLVFRGKAEIA